MPSIVKWGRRQLQDLQPYVDAVHEWRTVRQWEKNKAKKEKEERSRRSMEEWLQVERRSDRNHEQPGTLQSDQGQTEQGQASRRANTSQNNGPTAEYMYIDDIEPEYRHAQQDLGEPEQDKSERVWQEHIRRCLIRESSLKSQNRSNLWDEVQEGFEYGIGLEPERPSTPEVHTNPGAERQARRNAQRQQNAFEETYRERAGLQFEARRAKERKYRAASF